MNRPGFSAAELPPLPFGPTLWGLVAYIAAWSVVGFLLCVGFDLATSALVDWQAMQ